MAKEETYNAPNYWGLIATVVAVIAIICAGVGFSQAPVTEVQEKQVLVEVPADVNESEWVSIGDYTELSDNYDALLEKYADSEREADVKDIVKAEVEENYIEELGYDDEAFEDYDFEIAWIGVELDEDDGDYSAEATFLVIIREDGNVIENGIVLAHSTMVVRDDNAVRKLVIEFPEA